MDRLGVTGLDVRVELRLTGERADELASLMRVAWSRCLDQPASRHSEPITLALDEERDSSTNEMTGAPSTLADDDAERLMVRATQSVTSAAIAAQAGNLLMFHAGALSHPITGASLVFVAPGGTGKTTLGRTLGRRFGYLTDETVGIDHDGAILPYPKPLSIRTDHASAWAPKQERSPDEFGLLPAHPRPFVARMILLERSIDHLGQPFADELPLLDAITALAPETSSLSALDRGLNRCADLIESTGPVLRVRYAEAETLHALVTELIGRTE